MSSPFIGEPHVVKAVIVVQRLQNIVMVELSNGVIVDVVTYYPDELYFNAAQFVGLTVDQCVQLHMRKDAAYLKS